MQQDDTDWASRVEIRVMFQVIVLIMGEAIKLRFVLRFLVKDLRIATTTVNGQIVTWTQ
jgi:hypothetical protein